MGTPVENFLSEIDSFLKRKEMSASAFGKAALKDPSFVMDVRAGRMPNLGLVQRVMDFIASQEEPAE